ERDMGMKKMAVRPGLMLAGVALFAAVGGGFVIASQRAAQSARQIQTATSMSAAEKAEGAKAHPQLLNEFGGLYEGRQAAYVAQVGRRIATQSSLSSQQNDFTV